VAEPSEYVILVGGELGDGDIQGKNSASRRVAFDAVSTHLYDNAGVGLEEKDIDIVEEAVVAEKLGVGAGRLM